MATLQTGDDPMNWRVAFVLTALACALTSLVTLPLAIPPGMASPLHPAAGIAMAAVMIAGPRMLPAVGVGTFLAYLAPAVLSGFGTGALIVPATFALGTALQAWSGAALLRIKLRQAPPVLSEPRDIVVFLLVSAGSCLAGAVVAGSGMWATQAMPPAYLLQNIAICWLGSVLGVLIATPMVLTLFARPRSAWAPRRRSVGLTLTLMTLLLVLGTHQVLQWNRDRSEAAFAAEAANASLALSAQLREPLAALDVLYGLFVASDSVSADEMQLAASLWLARGGVQTLAWSERVRRADVSAFEARARAADERRYRVFEATLPSGSVAPAEDRDVIAIRYIEPRDASDAARGLDLMSNPVARAAIEAAQRSGQPAASRAFRLSGPPAGDAPLGVTLYRTVSGTRIATPSQPGAPLLGVVSVTVRLDHQLDAVAGRLLPSTAPSGVPDTASTTTLNRVLCLVDVSPSVAALGPMRPERLAGPPGCEGRSAASQRVQPITYAGRQWELRVSAAANAVPSLLGADVWLFALMGLFATATYGGFLLVLTGRAYRIESAVTERTAALQAEVHERESAEAALRESEQRFRNILNHVPIGVIYSDLNGNVKQTNPRFCELTGYSDREMLQLGVADYTHPDDLQQDTDLVAQLVRGEIPMYRRHKRYIAKNGDTVWVQATVSLLRSASGEPRSIVGVVEDITEHLRLEEAEHAREAAEASNRAKSEFLSRMSHELRTPLNAMLGFAQLLELDPRHPLTPEQRPWVTQIQQAGWHLLEMINDVLDLSRIESGNLRLAIGTLNLVELLDATTNLVEGDARQRRIAITREIGVGTATLLGDSTRVKQIFTNLLSNAVKYNAEGGRIHIASRLIDAETVEITVSDTGLGMTPGQMEGLFQPFNRLGRERSGQQGTGIGLVISQRLAELMGGALQAESAAGEGSAFHLRLPCAIDPDTVRSDLHLFDTEPAEYHRRLVHYVEDNETNVEVMRGILAQRPQVELQVSVTGLDGLAAIRARKPDLILLDMHLPDISGMDLLRHLKTDVYTTGVPIIVVSADALAQQIDAAFDAGCTRYLTKPVSVAELLAVLDDLLERMDTKFG